MDRYNPETPASELPLGERFTEGYDGLGRLIRSDLTKQVAGTAALQPWRTDTWALDVHGHWAGAIAGSIEKYGRATTNAQGLREVELENGTTRTIQWSGMRPAPDQTIAEGWTGTAAQSGPAVANAGFKFEAVEDGAGNVRFCGEFLYAFDAWNRLVAVWKARPLAGSVLRPRADAPHSGIEVGNWVKRFRYDALGRLIEVKSPMAGPEWPDAVLERVERFWYDGSRRIQEVTQDPIDLLYVVNKYGNEGLLEYITTGLIGALQGAPTGFPYRVLNREYIWGVGMGGGAGGVDELHVYFDRERRPWGVLQDSDGDNVAITNDGGDVVAEFVYDPYGAVIGQRSYGVHPPLKSGHRGLFAESLTVGTVGTPDADLGDPIETAAAWVDGRVLVPNERVVYHMRNRAYDPGPSGATAGRFIQRDPNASGAVLYGGGGGLGSHGAAPVAMVTGLDLAGHVGDGVNTYGYLRGRMRGAGDPSGLVVTDLVDTAVQVAVGGLRGGLGSMIGQYAMALEDNVDWATDWSQGDGAHSYQSSDWVMRSFADGMVQGAMEALDPTGGLLVDMLSGGEELAVAQSGILGGAATARKSLFLGRKMHGGAAHWRGMKSAAVWAKQVLGGAVSEMRTNQPLVFKDLVLSKKRPDLQVVVPNGESKDGKPQYIIYIIEICESQSKASAKSKWADVEAQFSKHSRIRVEVIPMTGSEAERLMRSGGMPTR